MQPMTPVIKNLIIINVIFYLATMVIGSGGVLPLPYLTEQFGAFYPGSPMFRPWQIITHMFMHSHTGITHIFFNMFALYMFGVGLERVWGSKRFLIYYLVCGLGGFFLHELVNAIEIYRLTGEIFPATEAFNSPQEALQYYYIPVVGASGAVFGILLGFGMLFPNTQIFLLFPPIPIKAKVFVFIYGAIELFSAFGSSGSNIAHFAHLGGMLFGYVLLKKWQRDRDIFF
ncbi:MAG: rhomboid family intramembrane serine protease [Flavobacteriales bacterium]|jgi:membrane associated rhomboid family serine protease